MSDNSQVLYQQLLIATGSSPTLPAIPGIEAGHVFTIHTLQDVNRLLPLFKSKDFFHVTIIGAGLCGLEAADAFRSQNLSVTVIDREVRVLSRQIDEEGSTFIEQKMESCGISFLSNQEVLNIAKKSESIFEVLLASQRTIRTNVVVYATGVRPNSQLAQSIGLQLYQNAIWTNKYLQTSNPFIYAAGDVAVVKDQITGNLIQCSTWPDAMHQGLIAAHAMAGEPKEYPGMLSVTSSSFFGVKFAVCGNFEKLHKGGRYTLISCKGSDDEYCKMLMKDGIPIGFALVGSMLPQLNMLRRAVIQQQPIAVVPAYRRSFTK